MNPGQLLRHCRTVTPDSKKCTRLIEQITRALREYEEQSVPGTYSYPDGKFYREDHQGDETFVGARILQQKYQRRMKEYFGCIRRRGAPRKDAGRLFVSRLALAYCEATGKAASMHWTNNPIGASKFERFCSPFLSKLGLTPVRDHVANHIKRRNKA